MAAMGSGRVIRFLSAQALSVLAGVMLLIGVNQMASIEAPLGPYYGFDVLNSAFVLALAGIVLAGVALPVAGRSRILTITQIAAWLLVLVWSVLVFTQSFAGAITFGSSADFAGVGVGDVLAAAATVVLIGVVRHPLPRIAKPAA
jgi:hypothetical protein